MALCIFVSLLGFAIGVCFVGFGCLLIYYVGLDTTCNIIFSFSNLWFCYYYLYNGVCFIDFRL